MSTQAEIFSYMNPELGAYLRDKGIDLVCSKNENFVGHMRAVAEFYSRQAGYVTSDVLRIYAMENSIAPGHQNTWGGIFRGRGWRCIGRQKSALSTNHAREIRVWRHIPEEA